MPLHDWSRVDVGVFHAFHLAWIGHIQETLNAGLLPDEYYALAEQRVPKLEADILTLKTDANGADAETAFTSPDGGATLLAPPKVKPTSSSDVDFYRRKQNRIAIRHASDNRLVAVIEIVSHGNKSSKEAIGEFVGKAVELFKKRVHLVILDPQRPSKRDPEGIHGAVWEEVSDEPYHGPTGKPFTAASYECAEVVNSFVERLAIGDPWPETPLFLAPDAQIPLPVEETYRSAFKGVPKRLRALLEAPPGLTP